MSPSLNIAILGASGTLGPFILQAISAHPNASTVCLRILARPTSVGRVKILVEQHADLDLTVHVIDYTNGGAGLDSALQGVDVVISAVGDDSGLTKKDVKHTGLLPGFITQDTVAKAAKAAGVKLFVPSEYGAPTHSIPLDSESYIVGKRLHHDLLRKLGLPFLLVYSGSFPETEPPVTPLPLQSTEAPIPLGEPPFETTRYHLAAYIVQLLFDHGIDAVGGGIYVLRGLRRDKGLISEETGKTEWVLDV
ncbi:hypothetical protein B0H16DRAFT_1626470 [Mycena metata]|uniref:NmrA-like domain-containing protein n=1 Tax=Mycena metata TaxID=1033252 RepID=A0AAD7H4B2_9AGAR|nr:hypothetical protein B0H16DRAFT_1626470 [Mycena metata]